jgi:glycosyltransferase involved in cell wall biosynthesis
MDNLPKITIITPSYNQAKFLGRTIRSVLDQGYPNLEYIIVDGGSTDGSVEIIRSYADRLTWWVSEPDQGQADAINKGLRRATGEWIAWQNSDDIYYPSVFSELAVAVEKYPEAGLIIGDMMLVDENDQPIRDIRYVKPSYNALLAEGMLMANQATFWRRELQDKLGLLDECYHCSFDYEWFLRLTQHSKGVHVNSIWGAFRLHGETKTNLLAERFQVENQKILSGRELPFWQKKLYKLRRMVLMLGSGQIGYVLRGIFRHVRGLGGDLY